MEASHLEEILIQSIENQNSTKKILSEISCGTKKIKAEKLTGSSTSALIASVFNTLKRHTLFVLSDKEEAAYYYNDLQKLISEDLVLFFPASYRGFYQVEQTDNANVLMRTEVLNRLAASSECSYVIVSYPEALFEKVVTRKELKTKTFSVSVGDTLSIDRLNEILFDHHFKRVDFVSEAGEFSVRGGIIDVFSFSDEAPYRIEFFGDEVESIRVFDVETQLSVQRMQSITLVPNIENKFESKQRQPFLDYFSSNTPVFTSQSNVFAQQIDKLYQKVEQVFERQSKSERLALPEGLFITSSEFSRQLSKFIQIETSPLCSLSENTYVVTYDTVPQLSFNKQFELLISHLEQKSKQGYTNYICCSSEAQAERFKSILSQIGTSVKYKARVLPLYQGFSDACSKMNFYTDHQIFERYHKFHIKNGYSKKQALTIKELNQLQVGDYVTHIDHGIGRFAGLQKIDNEGKPQEAIKLIYGDRDVLYVSIHSLHKITKYNGKDGKPPKIFKLGSGAWKALKQKTKKRVKEIAFNLIKLYAKRKESTGFAFSHDSYLQNELEASFLYEDTPDQSKATSDVKADMESPKPMDRLVCGDVGFGKTEVAIRAAFKAVDNGKQVVVLVPTTILAFQHYKTFSERLKDFPVNIDYLNRFRTAKEKKNIFERIASGDIDIIIGTHQIVSSSISYKDLGLLIVDEEQKFGVAVKDKLKSLKENIDVLTLTATPIPRTLQFSLMAARDLSVITTPPPNRYPIETQIIRWSEELIRDAVMYEIQRSGQVYFIHNRVENISEVAGMLQRLVPDARIAIGHGQMDGKKLEQIMLEFMEGYYDVLVATTIIESGLDVPNANTIFINNAHQFGLSDLHQMRGRVGRSNKKAFCYLISSDISSMSDEARKRMQAISQFSDLGSGFNIAMKDLEIRGAGDLLGGEQSGFINEIGFETYQKILQEAVLELKENEFSELYDDPSPAKSYVSDTQIDSDFELLFPDTYVNRVSERLNLYNELSRISTESELTAYRNRLLDRFGTLPPQAENLLKSVQLKWLSTQMGIERLVLKSGKMLGYFVSDQQSAFYSSDLFGQIIKGVQRFPTRCQIQEKQTRSGLRLILSFSDITTVNQAVEVLSKIKDN